MIELKALHCYFIFEEDITQETTMQKLPIVLSLLFATHFLTAEEADPAPSTTSELVLSKESPQYKKPITFTQVNQIIRQESQPKNHEYQINIKQVFKGAPLIYSVLLALSLLSMIVCLYTFFTLRLKEIIPNSTAKAIRIYLLNKDFSGAYSLCNHQNTLLTKMVGSAIQMRKFGPQVMYERLQSEGKLYTASFWQRITLLNDIAVIAPMLGLLGTVVGMFYAFYDLNRSMQSISILFDGLGISVGTTVAGLVVAILSMFLHTLLKYRLVKQLSTAEKEVYSLVNLMDHKSSSTVVANELNS